MREKRKNNYGRKERMVKRLLLICIAAAAAGTAAAVPAVAGLAGNPSFSHQLPVHVPSQARTLHILDAASRDEHAGGSGASHRREPEPDRSSASRGREREPRDDRSGRSHHEGREPGDDHGHDG